MSNYDVKIVECGNVIEIYKYSNPICTGYKVSKPKEPREQTEQVKQENLQRSIKRSKRKIFELVNTNYVEGKSSFLTITFKENITDYDLAFNYWTRFKKKVEYHYKIKLQYCGVVEFQKRGAIHFHICLFNVGYMEQEKLYNMWNSIVPGGINIQGIKNNQCDNVGAYMTHYMNKDLENSFGKDEYKGKKRYFYSRGLKEPSVDKLDTSIGQDKYIYKKILEMYEDNIVCEYKSIYERKETKIENITDMETGEIKKVINENIQYQQQLEYKQILLNKNEIYRNSK